MSGFFTVDPDWWELTVEKLERPFLPETAMLDLRFHQDQALMGGKFPSRSQLAARWGWTDKPVRNLLSRPDLWGDPGKATAWEGWLLTRRNAKGPAEVRPGSSEGPAEGQNETDEPGKSMAKGPAEVPQGSQSGPEEVHTRGDSQAQSPTQAQEKNKTSVELPAPQLELTPPRASVPDRFDEVAAYIGGVFNLNLGRGFSQGPERSSTRGKKLLAAVKKDANMVLDAFRFIAEGSGAEWHRTKWVDAKGRSRASIESVLRHLEEYAEGWRQEQLEGDGPAKPYVRGEHPGLPEQTEEEMDAAYARLVAKGVF